MKPSQGDYIADDEWKVNRFNLELTGNSLRNRQANIELFRSTYKDHPNFCDDDGEQEKHRQTARIDYFPYRTFLTSSLQEPSAFSKS